MTDAFVDAVEGLGRRFDALMKRRADASGTDYLGPKSKEEVERLLNQRSKKDAEQPDEISSLQAELSELKAASTEEKYQQRITDLEERIKRARVRRVMAEDDDAKKDALDPKAKSRSQWFKYKAAEHQNKAKHGLSMAHNSSNEKERTRWAQIEGSVSAHFELAYRYMREGKEAEAEDEAKTAMRILEELKSLRGW